MRNIFPLYAVTLGVLALALTFALTSQIDENGEMRATRDAATAAARRSEMDADRQYAANAGLRAALRAAGQEVPDDLLPRTPDGIVLLEGDPDGN